MILPDGPRVTLDEVSTELVLVGLREDAHRRRRELDRLARERLPRELGRALEGTLGSGDAVVRIRRLELDLDVAGSELTAGRLAAAWSRRLARVLREELRKGPGPNLAVFESHADFMAAYVELLVRGASPHPWAFGDFQALEHLDAPDAVVELLALRPRTLGAVARRLVVGGSPTGLPDLLGEARSRRLLETAAEDGPKEPRSGLLDELLRRTTGSHPPEGAGPFGRSVALLLRSLAGGAGDGWVAGRARAALALARAGDEVDGWTPDERSALGALLRGDPDASLPSARRRAVTPVLELVEARGGFESLLAALFVPEEEAIPDRGEDRGDAPSAEERPLVEADRDGAEAPEEGDQSAVRSFRTPFAGLALLVPVLRALELHEHLGAAQLRLLLDAVVGPEEAPRLAGDPLLDVLVPLEAGRRRRRPSREGWPVPRKSHLLGLRAGRREAVEEVADARGWADLAAAHLAARLHRLETSSLGYLREQFLARPGTVTAGPEEVRVLLDSLPLSVVLRMSGMLGDRGSVPWAGDRHLVVTLAGG